MVTFVPPGIRLWVNTPHGTGIVLCVRDYEFGNMEWTIAIQEDGRILHYDTKQINFIQNHTIEFNLENKQPVFPADK